MSGEITVLERRLDELKFQWTLKNFTSALNLKGNVILKGNVKSPVFQIFTIPFVLNVDVVDGSTFVVRLKCNEESNASNDGQLEFSCFQQFFRTCPLDVQGRYGTMNQTTSRINWNRFQSFVSRFTAGDYSWFNIFSGGLSGHVTVEMSIKCLSTAKHPLDPSQASNSATAKRPRKANNGASNDHEFKTPKLSNQSTQTDFKDCSYALNDEAIRVLECQVCHSLLEPPIKLCATGHSICLKCRAEINQCPSCKSHFQDGQRNYTLESLMDCISLPCDSKGCTAIYPAQRREAHMMEECHYRPMKCWKSQCDWSGQLLAYRDHVEARHYTRIARYNEFASCSLPLARIYENNVSCFLIAEDRTLFRMIVKETEGVFYLCILHFGTSTEAMKYSFAVKTSVSKVHCDLDCGDRECMRLGNEKQLRKQGLVSSSNGYLAVPFRITRNGE